MLVRFVSRWTSLTCYAFFTDDPEYRRAFAALEELDLCYLKPVFKEKRFRVRISHSLRRIDCTLVTNQTVTFYNSWCSICQVKSNLAWAWVNYIVFMVVFAVFPALYEPSPLLTTGYGSVWGKEIFIHVFEKVARGTCYPPRKWQILRQMYQFTLQVIWHW